jgi:hypothetical protein
LHILDFERNHAVSQMLGLWSLQISEFPTGDFGSNRQAVSVETDRPFRSKAAPRCGWVLVHFGEPPLRDTSYLALVCQSKYSCHYL